MLEAKDITKMVSVNYNFDDYMGGGTANITISEQGTEFIIQSVDSIGISCKRKLNNLIRIERNELFYNDNGQEKTINLAKLAEGIVVKVNGVKKGLSSVEDLVRYELYKALRVSCMDNPI